jgi:DNA-binding XRE family transcriptional regulator
LGRLKGAQLPLAATKKLACSTLVTTSIRLARRDPRRVGDYGNDLALLVGQTFAGFAAVPVCVPTRPSQNDPKRVAVWEKRRRQVGTRIQTLRLDRGYTQEELALRSGVSRNVLIDLEHGRRGILHERLFDIAKALGVSASELVEDIK